jgi:hypothetical protein
MRRAPAAPEEPESNASLPMGVQVLSFLCGLVVAIMGFKSAFQDYHVIHKLDHLEVFRSTPGRLLEVKLRRDSSGSDKDWYPDVLYEYFVDGKSIWGWRLSYEEEPKPRGYWETRLKDYAQGAAVTVYYDADNPKEAIIEKKHESLVRLGMRMGLGVLFLLAGLLLAVLPASAWIKSGFKK